MNQYQCYYLNGKLAGKITKSEFPYRDGKASETEMSPTSFLPLRKSEVDSYYRYLIRSNGNIYCVASQNLYISSESQALIDAKCAGLKPFPKKS